MCMELILGRDIGFRCAASWYDLDLTFDLAIVTYKILSGLYLRNRLVQEVDTW